MSATTSDTADMYWTGDTGRELDAVELLAQIGRGNVFAISGGRAQKIGPSVLHLPVSNGYHVYVWLMPNDTYKVERVFERSGIRYTKWTRTDVFADEVGEVAYQASCFRD